MFNLGIDVVNRLFKDDVYPGASFMPLAGGVDEVFAAGLALIDLSDLNGFHGSGITRTRIILLHSLALGTGLPGGAVIRVGLG